MAIRNCTRCGRVFSSTGKKVCPSCLQQEEEDFAKVKEYLNEHPGSGLEEVHRETGVDRDLILEFMRQGRIEAKGEGFSLSCRICGKPIRVGALCEACAREFGGVSSTPRERSRTRERMYTADMLKEKGDPRRK